MPDDQRERAIVVLVELRMNGEVEVRCSGTCGAWIDLYMDVEELTDDECYILTSGACHQCWGDTLVR